MERSETALVRRARRAYERGRLIRGLARAGLLVPVVVWTGSWCPHPVLGLVCGAALVALTAGFLWRGQVWRRAVGPGLAAGLAPLLLPLLMRGAGEVCMGEACWPLCAVSCVGGGLLAGVLVGRRAAALSEGRATFLAAAGMLALLAGAPACALAGAVGLGGLLVGFAAGTTPAVLARASA